MKTKRPPSVTHRADRLLAKLVDLYPVPRRFVPQEMELLRAAHVATSGELEFYLNWLIQRGLLKDSRNIDGTYLVAPEGYLYAEGMSPNIERSQGFVAMWFDRELDDAWNNGFEPGVRDAGWHPLRISGKQHINKICDEIIAEIRKSRFVVADFTGHRGGVYYEAGFAAGLGIPVFFSCREGELKELHFDVRQYNTIEWKTPSDLREQLSKRIEAVVGCGPKIR